ncbi:hypothetical protein SPV_2543 [Streptococcus pneumoniae]|nr:hypothetical protein SPV_2543 [Streptococcus pneumoniae]
MNLGEQGEPHREYFSLWCKLVQVIVPTAENLRP